MGLMEIHWRITISGNGADVVSHRTCGASTGGFVGSCLATKILKGPYLKPEVVEIMGWLG